MNEQLYIVELDISWRPYCRDFSCRNKYIDNFLNGSDSLEQDICKTFLLVLEADNKKNIVGYYSLAADCIFGKSDIYNSKEYKCGAIRILMFAIDEMYQHKKIRVNKKNMAYSHFLLSDCINRIEQITKNYIGAEYIVLESTKEAVNFYKKAGFEEIVDFDDDVFMASHSGSKNCIQMCRYIKNDI